MTKDKFLIAKYVDDSQANIMAKYEQEMSITAIAKLYNVAYTTIYYRLIRWDIPIRKHGGPRIPKGKRLVKHYKRQFSPEFLARRAEITRLNEGKIKYIKFEGVTEDQKLISNIIQHPILG